MSKAHMSSRCGYSSLRPFIGPDKPKTCPGQPLSSWTSFLLQNRHVNGLEIKAKGFRGVADGQMLDVDMMEAM